MFLIKCIMWYWELCVQVHEPGRVGGWGSMTKHELHTHDGGSELIPRTQGKGQALGQLPWSTPHRGSCW